MTCWFWVPATTSQEWSSNSELQIYLEEMSNQELWSFWYVNDNYRWLWNCSGKIQSENKVRDSQNFGKRNQKRFEMDLIRGKPWNFQEEISELTVSWNSVEKSEGYKRVEYKGDSMVLLHSCRLTILLAEFWLWLWITLFSKVYLVNNGFKSLTVIWDLAFW